MTGLTHIKSMLCW